MKILVSGGAGYIGSHFVKFLNEKNISVTVLDNLERGHREALPEGIDFIHNDLRDSNELEKALFGRSFDAIVHFAAYAYVGESVKEPQKYYTNNVAGTINLLNEAVKNSIHKIVFSSTCSVYGNPKNVPISEEETTSPINPYAQTKLMIEKILSDYSKSYGLKYAALRYFNAAGADFGGEIGESHQPEPHLIPIVLECALGKREKVLVFGDDYPTSDGTCVRDYIHVNDLADAHYKALNYLTEKDKSLTINLGTGKGYSVKEIIDTCEKVTGRNINKEISERRPGDPAILVADNKKAEEILNWKPKFNLEDIISSAWKWHQNQKY